MEVKIVYGYLSTILVLFDTHHIIYPWWYVPEHSILPVYKVETNNFGLLIEITHSGATWQGSQVSTPKPLNEYRSFGRYTFSQQGELPQATITELSSTGYPRWKSGNIKHGIFKYRFLRAVPELPCRLQACQMAWVQYLFQERGFNMCILTANVADREGAGLMLQPFFFFLIEETVKALEKEKWSSILKIFHSSRFFGSSWLRAKEASLKENLWQSLLGPDFFSWKLNTAPSAEFLMVESEMLFCLLKTWSWQRWTKGLLKMQRGLVWSQESCLRPGSLNTPYVLHGAGLSTHRRLRCLSFHMKLNEMVVGDGIEAGRHRGWKGKPSIFTKGEQIGHGHALVGGAFQQYEPSAFRACASPLCRGYGNIRM